MRLSPLLEGFRIRFGYFASNPGDPFGAFEVIGPLGAKLRVIVSDGKHKVEDGWEHVSVSLSDRVPTWSEMCFIKILFWEPEDCVVQFHPPKSAEINVHPNVLHLWRSTKHKFPLPPRILV